MWIKRQPGPDEPARWLRSGNPLLRAASALLLLAVPLAIGYMAGRRGPGPEMPGEGAAAPDRMAVSGDAATDPPPSIRIEVTAPSLERLALKREEAMKRGILLASGDDYVPAKIHTAEGTLDAEIRLKGDFVDQLATPRWPLRVQLKGDAMFMGMKRFSLHDPSARNFIYEWIVHQAMKREGVISLRYDFLDVTLNGRFLGLYAIEEHFDRLLIENNRRREGPIIHYSEQADFENYHHYGRDVNRDRRVDYMASAIDVYADGSQAKDPAFQAMYREARRLLEGFRRSELGACEAFDCDLLAKYFAMVDLFYARHAALHGNFKLYYNPVTARIEPIMFDAEYVGDERARGLGLLAENWYTENFCPVPTIFTDNDFFARYMKELERVYQSDLVPELLADLGPEIARRVAWIRRDRPEFRFDPGYFHARRGVVRKVLTSPVGLHAYADPQPDADGRIRIDFTNVKPFPVRVHAAVLRDGMSDRDLIPAEIPAGGMILPPTIPSRPAEPRTFVFDAPEGTGWTAGHAGRIFVRYAPIGLEAAAEVRAIALPLEDAWIASENPLATARPLSDFGFLRADESGSRIEIAPGEWRIEGTLLIPEGHLLVGGGGTTLELAAGAAIVSRSPLLLRGSEGSPFVIRGAEGAGGVAVLNAKERSALLHVSFENLGAPGGGGWRPTGAVTFYASPADMTFCRFAGARAEDALNIVRSDFRIERCLFTDSASDAFDADFSTGLILNSTFERCGNDAVDLSGGWIEAFTVRIDGAGDKGFSIGEGSREVVIRNSAVRNSRIGFAVKDLSDARIEGGVLENCRVGFTAYQKKPEFGPASMEIISPRHGGVESLFALESGSRITVDGRAVTANAQGLAARFEPEGN